MSATNAATFAQYAASLRLIAGQILSVRKTKKRFGPGKGGAQAYRAVIAMERHSKSFRRRLCNAGGWLTWHRPGIRRKNARA